MTDNELATRFHELIAQGPTSAGELNQLIKAEGGLSRLARLIPKPKQKRLSTKPATTPLLFDFPDESARANAMAYWRKHGREDLCAQIDRIADHFREHHAAADTKAANWPRTWTTWYGNQLEFCRPRPDTAPQPAAVAFQQTDRAGWVRRLEIFHGIGAEKAWLDVWGPKPGDEGCKVPATASQDFEARHNFRLQA